ncbi:MAG: hypothetical protein QCI00_09755 [Candidatus Thermoplasmatota archaeon]|nr:hypothetical protein [Candidatus Thermoplasmatota archaeon]
MPNEGLTEKQEHTPYSIEDAMKIVDDLILLQKEKKYHPGAFIHGLIFTLELTQQSYQIPPQQIAQVKRDIRRYVKELLAMRKKEMQ